MTSETHSIQTIELLKSVQRVIGLMASGKLPREVAMQLVDEGLDRHTAARYVASALELMRADSEQEPLSSKVARYRSMLHANIERALANKRQWVKDGEVTEMDSPDYKAVNGAIALLMDLDGVKGKSQP